MEKLLNGYKKTGASLDDFRAINKEMEDCTKLLKVTGGSVRFLSYAEAEKYQKPGYTPFYILDGDSVAKFNKLPTTFTHGYVENGKFGSQELLDEMRGEHGTQLCAVIDNKLYLISSLAIPTFTTRAQVKGDITISRNNLIRNLHLADAITSGNQPITFVYRERTKNGVSVRKVFAALSGSYKDVPQTILTDAIDKMIADGKMKGPELYSYSVDHEYTEAIVKFPNAAEEFSEALSEETGVEKKVTPGLYLCTSDTGASSVIVRGVYFKGSAYVITDEVKKKHQGNSATAENILEECDKTIFRDFKKLPETLRTLIGIEVCDYSKLDLTNENDAALNYRTISKLIADECNFVCKEAKIPGEKKEKLKECLNGEINSSIHYTLYDIAINFIGIAERIEGLDRDTIAVLRKACGQVPYRLEKKTDGKKLKKEKKEEISILPE